MLSLIAWHIIFILVVLAKTHQGAFAVAYAFLCSMSDTYVHTLLSMKDSAILTKELVKKPNYIDFYPICFLFSLWISYVLSCMTLEKELGIELLSKAIDIIRDRITAKGGKIDVKMAPKAVSIREETELQAMMDRLALENEEIDGDAPEDD